MHSFFGKNEQKRLKFARNSEKRVNIREKQRGDVNKAKNRDRSDN